MQMRIFENADALAVQSAHDLRAAIEEKPDLICCFAAGKTQVPTYALLADWVRKGELDVSRVRVIGLDEIVGARRGEKEGFHHFLDRYLFEPAGISDRQIVFFDALSTNLPQECARIDAWLDDNGPIDFLLLGIGGNGHIGYNEPGTPPDARTHTVALEGGSIEVGRKYFDHAFSYTDGITLGLCDLLAARRILVQATGESKIAAVEALRRGVVTRDMPVTCLLERDGGVEFYIDRDAAGTQA